MLLHSAMFPSPPATTASNSVTGTAGNGEFQLTSDQTLFQDFGTVSALGEIDLAAPYLNVYEPVISQNGSVNLTATNGQLYINSSVAGSSVNLSASGLLTIDAGSTIYASGIGGGVSINVSALNVSAGAQLLSLNSTGTLLVTSYNDSGPIFLTGDSYGAIDTATSQSELILGSEFFAAISNGGNTNFGAINIGDSNTSSITAQSFSGAAGTVAIGAGGSLNLTANSIGNDAQTTIQTDALGVVSNSANLSGLTSTSGGPRHPWQVLRSDRKPRR